MSQTKRSRSSSPVVKADAATHVFTIDVETTGMNLDSNYMTEFGAAFWRVGSETAIRTLYCSLAQPAGKIWSQKTLDQFWNNPDKGVNGKTPMQDYELRRALVPTLSPEDGMASLVSFLLACEEEVKAQGGKLVVVTDTSDYDTTWINLYLSRYTTTDCLSVAFGGYRPTRCISSFSLGIGRVMRTSDSFRAALDELKLEMPDWVKAYAHNHDPESDAKCIAASASFILSSM